MLRQNPADANSTEGPEAAHDRVPAADTADLFPDGAHGYTTADDAAHVFPEAAHDRVTADTTPDAAPIFPEDARGRVTIARATDVFADGIHGGMPAAEDALGVYDRADLPWYGLDAGWQGARALGSVSTGPDGMVEFGTLRHGDPPATRPDARAQRRSVTVLTMARLGRRPLFKPDGQTAGSVEAMTVSAAAALAGVGLVEDNWPWDLDPSVRQHWLDQQRELAYVVSEVLAGDPWQPLTLLVGRQQQAFHYRESPYGWVLAASRPDCFLAAYGRGVSAYSLAFVRVDPKLYA